MTNISYDFIVCGAGSSGSVIAARLAEHPDARVLLIEAGGTDDVPEVRDASQWPRNLGSERDWQFVSQPNPHLGGRAIPLPMGKVLGGGSSINAMVWARGHQSDWDYFASEAGDPAWSYEAVRQLYCRVEDWRGAPDPQYRGVGGPVSVHPAPNPHPPMLRAACLVGIPTFENPNGRMMEGEGGAAVVDLRMRAGERLSLYHSYMDPHLDGPNLSVLTSALVTRILFYGTRALGVEIIYGGTTHRIGATTEVILSLGAINTPKVLMQSGIGNADELRRFRIPVVQDLPGVGQNFQDHIGLPCVWEHAEGFAPQYKGTESTLTWKSDPALDSPDIQASQGNRPFANPRIAAEFNLPGNGWQILCGVMRPRSRGAIRLTGPDPADAIEIEGNHLSRPDDMRAAIACIELCREIGNSSTLRGVVGREIMPGNLSGRALEQFIKAAAGTYFHQTCTAKMGRDAMSVVDRNLQVYGIERLRVADGSILPRVTTGNTMAPCVIIGERAAEILRAAHEL